MSGLPRILIVGYAGQVGVELQRSFSDAAEIICHDRDTVDLAVADQVRAMVRSAAPGIILNAAAYTAVDRAESEPEAAMAVNAMAPGILAEEAMRLGALLVHYSTDYVFDGSKSGPWIETDNASSLWYNGRFSARQAVEPLGSESIGQRKGSISMGQQSPHCPA